MTYHVLHASGLEKPDHLSEKKFEYQVLETLKKVNENVTSVYLISTKGSKFYIVKVYFLEKKYGREFIVDYVQQRKVLFEIFKKGVEIHFDFNKNFKDIKKMNSVMEIGNESISNIKRMDENHKRQQAFNQRAYQSHINLNYNQGFNQYGNNHYQPRNRNDGFRNNH